jgi:thioredoxin-like negative regulator of GroEL
MEGPVDRTRSMTRYVALGLLALLAAYSFVRFSRYRGLGAQVLKPGTVVEPFALTGLDGAPFELGKSGRPALVVFWASHCRSCKVELPVLQRVAADYRGRIDVVTVADDEPEALALAAARLKLTLPVLLDAEGRVTRQFDVFTIPYNVLVGADRKVVTDFVGPPDEKRIRTWFEAALGKT